MEVRVNIELGDARKAGGVSLWAKQVEKVDITKENGYAFEGRFLSRGKGKRAWKYNEIDDVVPVGSYVVAIEQTGSWNHPSADIVLYKAEENGLKQMYRETWSSAGTNIEKLTTKEPPAPYVEPPCECLTIKAEY